MGGCSISKQGSGDDKKVSIEAPGASIQVDKSKKENDSGIPLYPGAQEKLSPGDEGNRAHVNLSMPFLKLKVVKMKFTSDDPTDKVLAFYRDKLGSYGTVLECKGAETSTCLTKGQVQAARQIYSGLTNPRTKSQIFPGLEPGSELGWGSLADGAEPSLYIRETFKYLAFKDPQWDYKTHPVDFDADAATAERNSEAVSATNPDLRPFFSRGGKMIIYHGWTDPLIAPGDSVNYYKRVVDTVGSANASRSLRLYMVPGMHHCRGGEGPDDFDMQPIMEQWREEQKAPASVVASKISDGKVVRTRPLCPYPQTSAYKGAGSIDDAANFVCR